MRSVVVALVVAVVVATASLPAAAQTYQTTIQIRYWGTGLSFGNPAPPTAMDSGSAWGGTLRLDSRNNPWSFSARYDAVNVTQVTLPWTTASMWDAKVHYRFGPSLNSYAGVYAGYAGVSQNSAPFPTFNGSASGFLLGAEFMHHMAPGGWYVTGEAAYGISWNTSAPSAPGIAASNVTDLRIATGYEFMGGWGLEAGWRYYSWRIGAGPGCTAPGCEFQFSGVTAALTFRK